MKGSDKIPGGKSDNLTKAKIAQKFGKSEDYIKKQMIKGAKVELEHTNDFGLAQQIALNHISQFPDYYERLDTMQKQAQKDFQSLNESDLSIDTNIKLSNVVLHIPSLKEYYSKNKLRLSSDLFKITSFEIIEESDIFILIDLVINNFKELVGFFDYSIEESNAILSVINNTSEKNNLFSKLLKSNTDLWLIDNPYEVDNRKEIMIPVVKQKKQLRSNILEWINNGNGYHIKEETNLVASWYNSITGRNFVGGTSIGKSPQTLILDITYNGAEIYISGNGTIKLCGEIVSDKKEFKQVLDKNFKLLKKA